MRPSFVKNYADKIYLKYSRMNAILYERENTKERKKLVRSWKKIILIHFFLAHLFSWHAISLRLWFGVILGSMLDTLEWQVYRSQKGLRINAA